MAQMHRERLATLAYYGALPSGAATLGSVWLLLLHSVAAGVGTVLLALVPLAEGAVLVFNVGGATDEVVRRYKREPASVFVRNLHPLVIRFSLGGMVLVFGIALTVAGLVDLTK